MFFKKRKSEKKEKPVTWKRIVLKSAILGTVAMTLGVGAGFGVYYFVEKSKGGDYSNVDVAAITDDLGKAQEKYNSAKRSGTPLESALKPSEMVNVALAKFSALESSKTIGLGKATAANVDQIIQSIQIRDGDLYFEESNSESSVVKLYDRMYQEGETTSCYWGQSLEYSKNEKKEYSNSDYADLMGRNVSDCMIYVISSKTTITKEETAKKLSGKGASKIQKEGNGYTVDLELNPQKAVVNYVKQMKNISGLKDYPAFSYCHLTFHLSEDLMPIDFTSYEKYNATKQSMPIPVEITGSLTTYFYTEGGYKIPGLGDETQSEYKTLSAQ